MKSSKAARPKDGNTMIIYRATRRDPKTGKILRARDYGLKAWPIRVPIKR